MVVTDRILRNRVRRLAGAFAAAVALAVLPALATAQAYPDRPVRIITGGPPGSPSDVLVRAIAARLSADLGQSFLVENRAGANYNIASEAVAKSPADGYTLLSTAVVHSINPALYPQQPFDAVKDFAPITIVAAAGLILAVHPSVPASSVQDLIKLAKSQPGTLTFGSAGIGSTTHLSGEMFNNMAGVQLRHVPYKGVTQAATDLLGGHVSMMFGGTPVLFQHIKAGKLRALAVTTDKRIAVAPELPTIAEAGLPGYEISAWYGFMAPARTPPAILGKLHAAFLKTLQHPDVKRVYKEAEFDIMTSESPDQFASFVKTDIVKWARIIKDGNIKAE